MLFDKSRHVLYPGRPGRDKLIRNYGLQWKGCAEIEASSMGYAESGLTEMPQFGYHIQMGHFSSGDRVICMVIHKFEGLGTAGYSQFTSQIVAKIFLNPVTGEVSVDGSPSQKNPWSSGEE